MAWYKRLVCLWLAAFVLLGSVGHVVAEHWCQMRGKKMQLLLTNKDCKSQCPDNLELTNLTGPVIYKTPCCKDVQRFERLEASSQFSIDHFQFPSVLADWQIAQASTWLFAVLRSTPPPCSNFLQADDPPIRSGRYRLLHFCTWLI
ncbi:hypothetical protein [Fibrisoma limi]|uniref:hypothetical protein n=1 Tax=Fibrisoma limi TaxID=663275 RepID=UPI00058713BD|nr:hypothetical protein [Fibrisoma limi]